MRGPAPPPQVGRQFGGRPGPRHPLRLGTVRGGDHPGLRAGRKAQGVGAVIGLAGACGAGVMRRHITGRHTLGAAGRHGHAGVMRPRRCHAGLKAKRDHRDKNEPQGGQQAPHGVNLVLRSRREKAPTTARMPHPRGKPRAGSVARDRKGKWWRGRDSKPIPLNPMKSLVFNE